MSRELLVITAGIDVLPIKTWSLQGHLYVPFCPHLVSQPSPEHSTSEQRISSCIVQVWKGKVCRAHVWNRLLQKGWSGRVFGNYHTAAAPLVCCVRTPDVPEILLVDAPVVAAQRQESWHIPSATESVALCSQVSSLCRASLWNHSFTLAGTQCGHNQSCHQPAVQTQAEELYSYESHRGSMHELHPAEPMQCHPSPGSEWKWRKKPGCRQWTSICLARGKDKQHWHSMKWGWRGKKKGTEGH